MHRDIDQVIEELQRTYPGLVWEQLRVAHPGADDDGVWFFRHPRGRGEVQVESPSGQAPFCVEGDHQVAREAATVAQAVEAIVEALGLRAGTV